MKRLLLLIVALLCFTSTAFARMDDPPLRVAGALVTVKQDDALVWNVRWVIAHEDMGKDSAVITFAAPLPKGETMIPRDGVTPVMDDGHIVGVRVDKWGNDRMVQATFVQPGYTAHGPLGVPFADGTAIQILDSDMGAGARLEMDRNRLTERRVAQAAREEAVRLTGYQPQPSDTAYYLRGSDVRAANGLRGAVVTIGERTARMSMIAAVAFAAMVAALFFAWRSIRRAAASERADAVLAEEIGRL